MAEIKKSISDVINYLAIELVPTALRAKKTQWRYTTTAPAGNWKTSAFDDSAWSVGVSGFGDGGAPNTSYDNKSTVNTEWKSNAIFLRKTFNMTAQEANLKDKLRLILYHDDDCEVYINGVLAFKASGYTSNYTLFDLTDAAKNSLKQGENTIAISCKQFSGGQYIDAGLILDNCKRNDDSSTDIANPSSSGNDYYLVPNPTKGVCSVEGGGDEAIQNIKLFSLSGKFEGCFDYNKLDTSRIDKGVYIVQVNTVKASYSLRLIKE